MTPVEHPTEIEERQTTVAQERLSSELPRTAPLISPKSTAETVREEPPLNAPPVPPRNPVTRQPRRMPPGARWAWAMGMAVFGGLVWWIYGFAVAAAGLKIGQAMDMTTTLIVMLVAAVPALTCLIAGWLLRSWAGLIMAAVVYVAVTAIMWVLAIGGGPGDMTFWTIEFALYVGLPALVMSVIGTALGMLRSW